MNVYYLGPEKSFSHVVAQRMYGDDQLQPCKSFDEVLERAKADDDSVGILPIENTITSSVHENYDLIFSGDMYIVGEASLKIKLALIGLDGARLSDASAVHSHHKALAQCSEFIKDQRLAEVEHGSTSAALSAILDANDPAQLLIADAALADDPRVQVLQDSVGNFESNFTRFVCIAGSSERWPEQPDRVCLKFNLEQDEPGGLAKVLTAIAGIEGNNMTKIESRPIPEATWEYEFWIEMDILPQNYQPLLDSLTSTTANFKIYGQYKKGPIYD